jgi:hypothetical protein
MRYKKPFTPQQRQQALLVLRSFRNTFDTLRRRFRPRTQAQRKLARELRKSIEDFRDVLKQPDDKLNIERLNELKDQADSQSLRYSWISL